ncbi:uncharacterized protein LOC111446559 isoform X2 [Cucurbita moschata]|uniref:Uncharacterized protein LOC111446559 isoform X2 n=1 Tax=Cucurbita moschata TaxID=3662 RepID=A0A6J1FRE9_CUCMO|nr:uncharacterized protein LOC111446559 isoform X2 [Cucurbita moschata]
MNDWSATHYCRGGESGWTMYLDQSYTSGGGVGENYREIEAKVRAEKDEEEEDLSMVSDASSGPPNYNEECFYNNGDSASESAMNCSREEKKKSKKGKQNGRNDQHSYLDDTASSTIYGYGYGYGYGKKINGASSKEALETNAIELSQGFSATHVKRKPAVKKRFGFYRSERSAPEE